MVDARLIAFAPCNNSQRSTGLAKDLPPLHERQHMAIGVRTQEGPVFQAAFIFEITRLKH
jgi:hypothetical protein